MKEPIRTIYDWFNILNTYSEIKKYLQSSDQVFAMAYFSQC